MVVWGSRWIFQNQVCKSVGAYQFTKRKIYQVFGQKSWQFYPDIFFWTTFGSQNRHKNFCWSRFNNHGSLFSYSKWSKLGMWNGGYHHFRKHPFSLHCSSKAQPLQALHNQGPSLVTAHISTSISTGGGQPPSPVWGSHPQKGWWQRKKMVTCCPTKKSPGHLGFSKAFRDTPLLEKEFVFHDFWGDLRVDQTRIPGILKTSHWTLGFCETSRVKTSSVSNDCQVKSQGGPYDRCKLITRKK